MSIKKLEPLKATYDLKEIFQYVASNLEYARSMLLAADEIEGSMYESGCSTDGSTTPVRGAGLPKYIRLQSALLAKVAAKIDEGETEIEIERGTQLHEMFLDEEEYSSIKNDAGRIYDTVAESRSLVSEFTSRHNLRMPSISIPEQPDFTSTTQPPQKPRQEGGQNGPQSNSPT